MFLYILVFYIMKLKTSFKLIVLKKRQKMQVIYI